MRPFMLAAPIALAFAAGCGGGTTSSADVEDVGSDTAPGDTAQGCPTATVTATASCIYPVFDCFDYALPCSYDQPNQRYTFADGATVHFDMATLSLIWTNADGTDCFRYTTNDGVHAVFVDMRGAGTYGWDETDYPCVALTCADESRWVLDGDALGEALGWTPNTVCSHEE